MPFSLSGIHYLDPLQRYLSGPKSDKSLDPRKLLHPFLRGSKHQEQGQGLLFTSPYRHMSQNNHIVASPNSPGSKPSAESPLQSYRDWKGCNLYASCCKFTTWRMFPCQYALQGRTGYSEEDSITLKSFLDLLQVQDL